MTAPTLRPYQLDAGTAIEDALLLEGVRRPLIKMPTGTGKTVLFAALLKTFPRLRAWARAQQTKHGMMLVIAHREELLEQAREKIEAANPGLMVSIEQGDRYANAYSDVVVASIQTLQARKFARLKRLLARHGHFPIVIVDEAHHAAAKTYRTALAYLGFLPLEVSSETGDMENPTHDDVAQMKASLAGWDAKAPTDRLLLGVTATPNRSDAIGLECVFQSIAYSYSLRQAIADGWLVPPTPWVVETKTELVDLSGKAVGTVAGDFNQRQLAEAVNTPRRNQLGVAAWHDHAAGRPTLAFTVDVQHAHDLAAAFVQAGVSARAVSGVTPKEERRQILRDFTARRIDVITNCMVLTEGVDLPLASCILHMKPTESATLYEQMTGRGLRLFAGKRDCIVIDLVDIARRHSLQTAPVLYGLPPGLKTTGDDLKTIADALDALRARVPGFDLDGLLEAGRYTLAELQAKASTFDVWSVPDLGALRSVVAMNWIKVGADAFRLQYPWSDGMEVLQVERDLLGHYDISLTLRPTHAAGDGTDLARRAPAPSVRQRTIAAQVSTVEAALQLAERFVQSERRSVARLRDREAPWRRNKPSEKMLAYARRLGAPVRPGMTAGQVGDLIDSWKAKRFRA